MNYLKTRRLYTNPASRLLVVLVILASLVPTTLVNPVGAQRNPSARLSEDQKIMHALNRLGLGARPGDVERVKAMGLDNYINQQLNPEKISDTVAENKIRDLNVLNMTTAELYGKFPQPGQLLRQLQARGMLPADLAEARENRVKGGKNSTSTEMPSAEMPSKEMKRDSMPSTEMAPNAARNNQN